MAVGHVLTVNPLLFLPCNALDLSAFFRTTGPTVTRNLSRNTNHLRKVISRMFSK